MLFIMLSGGAAWRGARPAAAAGGSRRPRPYPTLPYAAGPVGWLYPVEIQPLETRAAGAALNTGCGPSGAAAPARATAVCADADSVPAPCQPAAGWGLEVADLPTALSCDMLFPSVLHVCVCRRCPVHACVRASALTLVVEGCVESRGHARRVNMLFTFIIGQCFVAMLCAMHYGVRPAPCRHAARDCARLCCPAGVLACPRRKHMKCAVRTSGADTVSTRRRSSSSSPPGWSSWR